MELRTLNKELIDQYIAAGVQSTPPALLHELAGHFCDKIRSHVASNPATPADILNRLSEDQSPDVRVETAINPSTPGCALNRLVHDEDQLVRYKLASNIDAPVWMLEELALDQSSWVRSEAQKTMAVLGLTISHQPNVMKVLTTGRPCIWSRSGALTLQPSRPS